MGSADNDEARTDIAAPQQPRHPAGIHKEPRSEEWKYPGLTDGVGVG